MSINRVEFANFVCRFGNDKVMLDYLIEIVLPIFTDDTLVRQRGRENVSAYFFYDVHLEILDKAGSNEIVGVFGQFVKNVNLTRTQVFDPSQGLVQAPLSMPSSPSSTFLLILNTHRLVFLPRTQQAPTIQEFESTVRNFAAIKHNQFINATYESRKNSPEKTTKKALRQETPPPEVNVVPLTNLDSVADFVARFDKLRSIDFRLLRPNPTIDAEDTFKDVRGILENIGANSGKLSASNNTDGLDKDTAITVINDAAKGGNSDITLKGTDEHGAILSGSNEDFKVSVPLDSVPQTRPGLVRKLYQTLRDILPASAAGSTAESAEGQAKLNNLAKDI